MQVPKDQKRAVLLHQKACDEDIYYSCQLLASLYEKGETVPQDKVKALSLYEKACVHDELICKDVQRIKSRTTQNLHVSIGSVSLMGDAEQEKLDAVIGNSFPTINQCYLELGIDQSGSIKLQFRVQSGAIQKIKVKHSSFANGKIESCTINAIQAVDVSKIPSNMTHAAYTIDFKQ